MITYRFNPKKYRRYLEAARPAAEAIKLCSSEKLEHITEGLAIGYSFSSEYDKFFVLENLLSPLVGYLPELPRPYFIFPGKYGLSWLVYVTNISELEENHVRQWTDYRRYAKDPQHISIEKGRQIVSNL